VLPSQLVEEIYAQAKVELPNECCGLLAGRVEDGAIGRVVRRYPLVNVARSPIEYNAHPDELFAADRDMRRLEIQVLAVYHSHPTSPPVPSLKDLARNGYEEDAIHLIISLKDALPMMRAWWLAPHTYREADWSMVEAAADNSTNPA